MRILLLHADRFSYHVTGETSISKQLDPIPKEMMEGLSEEVLVCLMAIEKGDAGKIPAIVENAAKEIREHCERVNSPSVMLYPYAHLSSSLESPRAAVRVLDQVEEILRKTSSLTVLRAPFGFYKSFEVKVKGHPLSEHGRTISGELVGLKRLRTFTMPDLHTLCGNVQEAKDEMLNQVDLSHQWMTDLGYDYVVAVRAVKDFFGDDSGYAREIARKAGQPILLEIWDQRYFYFVTKFEANIVDSQGKASALSTVQIDVENPAGFDITYVDRNGESKHPLMLHTSVSGSIDRNLYALLEQQAKRMRNSLKASYPFWLAPTQIRLIPVKEYHLDLCMDIAGKLEGRVDIDDREETLSKRIRAAEREWVPVIIAIGDREAESETLPVRLRATGKQQDMTLVEINEFFRQEVEGKVYRPLNLPVKLSLRPMFRG